VFGFLLFGFLLDFLIFFVVEASDEGRGTPWPLQQNVTHLGFLSRGHHALARLGHHARDFGGRWALPSECPASFPFDSLVFPELLLRFCLPLEGSLGFSGFPVAGPPPPSSPSWLWSMFDLNLRSCSFSAKISSSMPSGN